LRNTAAPIATHQSTPPLPTNQPKQSSAVIRLVVMGADGGSGGSSRCGEAPSSFSSPPSRTSSLSALVLPSISAFGSLTQQHLARRRDDASSSFNDRAAQCTAVCVWSSDHDGGRAAAVGLHDDTQEQARVPQNKLTADMIWYVRHTSKHMRRCSWHLQRLVYVSSATTLSINRMSFVLYRQQQQQQQQQPATTL
jgi:hypothetical protein